MPIDINSIADESSTVPENSEAAPDTGGIPTEVLELPIFAGILQGSPAALWVDTGDTSVESKTAVKFQKPLSEAGIFLYRDKPSGLDLIFNGQFISKELLDTAAKKGKLKEVASSLTETVAALNGVAPAAGGGATLPASAMPSSVPVDGSLTTARKNNLEPGSPSEGPMPGSGRVLNSLMKPTI